MTNLAIVREMYDAFGRKDGDALRRLFHPDIEWVQNDGFPHGGRTVGAEKVLGEVFGKFRTEWSEWKVDVREYLDAGDTIVAIGDYRGTYRATGKSMTAAFAHVYDVHAGRITRFRQFTDTAMLRASMRA